MGLGENMNTTELIEHIQQHIITIAVFTHGACDEHIFWPEGDHIGHEFRGMRNTFTRDEMIEFGKGLEWEIHAEPTIKVDPESGQLLCPKCGNLMHAHFTMETEHIAFIESGNDAVVYDSAVAEIFADVTLEHVSCLKCQFTAVANSFTLDRSEYDNKHPTSEWKEDNA
jgi:hypothetical protein